MLGHLNSSLDSRWTAVGQCLDIFERSHVALRSLSLCAGFGGIELGLEAAGVSVRPVCFVEREGYAAANLVALMEAGEMAQAPIWSELETFNGRAWRGAVDCVLAGWPCQPFSTASRGRRVAPDLWPHVARIVGECRAPIVFLENVASSPVERAGRDLAAMGYDAAIGRLSSAAVGAPHRRDRWWLLAHYYGARELLQSVHDEMARVSASSFAHWWSAPRPELVGMDDGTASGAHRLRLLGNGVVPAQAGLAFVLLDQRLAEKVDAPEALR